jgi:hypothetical protein
VVRARGEAIRQPVAVSFAGADPQDLTVIGVTAAFVSWQMGEDREQLLVPLDQHPVSRVLLIARTDRDVSAAWWTAAFRRGVQEVDREVTPGPLASCRSCFSVSWSACPTVSSNR